MTTRSDILNIEGVRIDVERRGKGRPLLLLHGEDGFEANLPLLDDLARNFEIVAPRMPGFGKSMAPESLRSIDDVQNELRKESGQDATDARDNMFRAFDQSDLSIDMIRGQMRKSKRQQRIYLSAILGILSMLVAAAIAVPLTVDGAFGHYKTNDSPQAEGDCYLNTTNPSTSVLLSEVAISISPVDNLGENRTQHSDHCPILMNIIL